MQTLCVRRIPRLVAALRTSLASLVVCIAGMKKEAPGVSRCHSMWTSAPSFFISIRHELLQIEAIYLAGIEHHGVNRGSIELSTTG